MSRELERRLIKMETLHHAANDIDARISRMTDADLSNAIRACRGRLEEELGPDWREWLAVNDPHTEALLRECERQGDL